jgi:hypothetical protein
MGKDQDDSDGDERAKRGSTLCHNACRKHTVCQSGLVDNTKIRVLLYLRDSRDLREKRDGSDLSSSRDVPFTHVSLAITEGYVMDMMGRVGLIEIPILIAPDQKVWMDRMIKEGKIAIPPGGTLEKGSLYSMFVRMLLHNAMEEQKRQEVLDAEDEDDE